MRVVRTETRDFADDELVATKEAMGQVYLDVSTKLAPDDFATDLRKLAPRAPSARPASAAPSCTGCWEPRRDDVFTRDDARVRELVAGLSGPRARPRRRRGRLPRGAGSARAEAGAIEYVCVDPDEGRARACSRRATRSRASSRPAPRTSATTLGAFDHVLVLRSYNHLARPGRACSIAAPRPAPPGRHADAGRQRRLRPGARRGARRAGRGRAREPLRALPQRRRRRGGGRGRALLSSPRSDGRALRLLERRDIGPETSNQWLLRYECVEREQTSSVSSNAWLNRASPTAENARAPRDRVRRLPERGAHRGRDRRERRQGHRPRGRGPPEAQLGAAVVRLQQPLHLLPRLERARRDDAQQHGHQGADHRGPEEGRRAAHPLRRRADDAPELPRLREARQARRLPEGADRHQRPDVQVPGVPRRARRRTASTRSRSRSTATPPSCTTRSSARRARSTRRRPGLKAALASDAFIVNIDIVINKQNVKHLPDDARDVHRLGRAGVRSPAHHPVRQRLDRRRATTSSTISTATSSTCRRRSRTRAGPTSTSGSTASRRPYTEGFEDLIQDPYKLNDEVRGRREEYDKLPLAREEARLPRARSLQVLLPPEPLRHARRR